MKSVLSNNFTLLSLPSGFGVIYLFEIKVN